MTIISDGSKVSSALAVISDETALYYLRRYYGLGEWQGKEYTGSHFDTFLLTEKNKLTAEDIVAVSCLSIHVPSRAAMKVLSEESSAITALLIDIATNTALEDVPFEDHDKCFGKNSFPQLLWELLREHRGIGPTTASKIIARKRPALIPIYDSVVARVTGFTNSDGTWRAWHHAFSTDKELTGRLRFLREAVGLEHISLLRILDVVLWMHGTHGVEEPERVDDSPAYS